ncbi:DUF4097 family beta strand repeat-containing protein [Streptomyces sp. NPDC004549]|uniref:DUF4097 family beta strand repeat-containing protein n=1 Tax=Streptomyces sp. NPDC004549 TaxID=3154283 RepID=UPI0033B21E2F
MSNFEIVKRGTQQPPAQTESTPADRILLAEAAKAGVAPLTTYTGDEQHAGPVLATVTAQEATLWASVDGSLSVPTVRVYCADPNSPYAQAARDSRIQLSGNQLTVTVPRITAPPRTVHYGSGTYFSGSGSTYGFASVGDGHISSSSVTFTSSNGGTLVNGHRGIEIELLLPSGSGLHSNTSSGSIHTFGHLAATKIDAASGSVNLASVGRAEIDAASGSVQIGTVTEWTDINAASGSVKVTRHTGHQARVRAASGSVTFTIAAEASGTVDIRSASGSITLHGSHRTDMTINATASSGSVRRR